MLTLVPPNDCIRAREAVSLRLDGELPELDRARLDAHLRRCDDCRAFAASAAAVAVELRNAALEPVPALVFAPRERRPRVRAASLAAAVAVVAAVVGPSFFVGKLLSPGKGGAPATSTAASTPLVRSLHGLDPTLVAMLDGVRSDGGRLIAA
jgi:predicted anti-sigma-YlaC factor YlaD